MVIKYIQAAVSLEDHTRFTLFAKQNELTMGELIETAVSEYIQRRKEVDSSQTSGISSTINN